MTEAEANKALLARWITLWHTKVGGTQQAPAVPYSLDNRKLEVAPPFASVEINNLDGDQETFGELGRRKFLRMGFLDVKLYGPPGAGRGSTDQLAEYVRDIFESKTIGAVDEQERGIRTWTTSGKPIKNDKEYPGLWCFLVRTPYEFTETK